MRAGDARAVPVTTSRLDHTMGRAWRELTAGSIGRHLAADVDPVKAEVMRAVQQPSIVERTMTASPGMEARLITNDRSTLIWSTGRFCN